MDATPAPEAAPTTDAVEAATEPAAATAPTAKRATRSTATKSVAAKAAPVRTASAQAPARPAPAAPVASTTPAPTSESAVTPVVDTTAPAPAPATAQAAPAQQNNNEVPVIAGGALALLALGGGAFAIARRRREEEEDVWVDDQVMADEPAAFAEPVREESVVEPVDHEQPKIVTPAVSAFNWGNSPAQPAVARPAAAQASADDDRMPGESWVERAYRGPTPNNPSVSLRNRLKRAAFFDKREREVAAGTAKPVDMDAGLPEAMVEERERELA
jgi:hypothetical protein